MPVITDASRRSMGYALAGLRQSVGSSLDYSFFRTKQMRATFSSNRLKGVLPVLYLFLARSGKTVHEVTPIGIDADGQVVAGGTRDAAPAVKIVFSGGEGTPQQTLYYVQTDVSDHGLKKTGFLGSARRSARLTGLSRAHPIFCIATASPRCAVSSSTAPWPWSRTTPGFPCAISARKPGSFARSGDTGADPAVQREVSNQAQRRLSPVQSAAARFRRRVSVEARNPTCSSRSRHPE